MRFAVLVLASCLGVLGSNATSGSVSVASFASAAGDFGITATKDATTQLVTIAVQSTQTGYIAVGLGSFSMAGANMFVGWVDQGKVVLSQRSAHGHVMPTVITTQPTWSQVPFPASTVPLAGVQAKFAFSIPVGGVSVTGPTSFIYAVSGTPPTTPSDPASPIAEHDDGAFGSFSLDLTKVGATVGTTTGVNSQLFKLIHGITMFLAWGVFPFLGVFVARYLKARLGHNWYRIHVACMIGGPLILSIAGLVAIELQIASGSTRFITSTHGIVGTVISFAFLPLQITLGYVANHFFNPNRIGIPWYDQAHWWIGRLVMLAALVNIYLGITAYGLGIMWVGVYVGWVVVMFVILALGQYFFGASHHVKGNPDFELDEKPYGKLPATRHADTPSGNKRRGNNNNNHLDLDDRSPPTKNRIGASAERNPTKPDPSAQRGATRPGYQSPFDLGTEGRSGGGTTERTRPSGRGDASEAFRNGAKSGGSTPTGGRTRGGEIPARGDASRGGTPTRTHEAAGRANTLEGRSRAGIGAGGGDSSRLANGSASLPRNGGGGGGGQRNRRRD
ncbi:hypothetical protein HDU98_004730 [Podochytrium sp. JEL0797]|nr:hypothetical protein HDU98_004730 [Podochytrium sp. JEL0797]